ncbi:MULTISPECIES: S-layer homology domain-containing protein [unclassified Paenibacillus]|uniref:S-layer homology domain-containing protein n=1 Tax=unclassified Paenibacillus TaxID=185978 RepID=UPI000FE23DD0|nr:MULTISPECIES: S-layer homology domain-containing protein [unclassified Paenibacillus]MCM3172523.1 S-layer homology domain-containing protein [Paenibacillus sp. MER 99-2]
MGQPKKKRVRFKRTMSSLIALSLLSSLALPSIAGAAPSETFKIQIDSVSVQAGQSVHVPVTLKKPERNEVTSYNMQVDYDSTALEIVRITPKYGKTEYPGCAENTEGCFQYHFDNESGWVRIIWADFTAGDHNISSEQQLFDIEFKAKSNATSGVKQLTIQNDSEHWNFSNSIYQQPAEWSGGAITITGGSSSGGGNSGTNPSTPPTSSTGGTPSTSTTSPAATTPSATPAVTKGVDIYVNGQKQEQSATASTSTIGNQVTTTVKVDNEKVITQIGSGLRSVMLPITGTGADKVVGELNGKLVKAMDGKDAELILQTDFGTYTLPANQLQIDRLASELGAGSSLENIVIQLTVSKSSDTTKATVEAAAAKQSNTSIVGSPIDFEVRATVGEKQFQVNQFDTYVERTITLPDDIDPTKITTGVVLLSDGSVLHVPTKVRNTDGHYSAVINSLTNSTYALVYHQATFDDIVSHWSRNDVEDLASRMIIQGTSEGTFAPDRSITRAEFTAVLLRSLGLHTPKGTESIAFSDVSDSSWYADEVKTAVSYGLVNGYSDDSFRPSGVITRAEALTIISRAMNLVELEQASSSETAALLNSYSDGNNVQTWAADPVASAIKQGLVEGSDGKLMANSSISRSQTVAIVKRLLSKAGLI